jgi:hypothetical protein
MATNIYAPEITFNKTAFLYFLLNTVHTVLNKTGTEIVSFQVFWVLILRSVCTVRRDVK